MNGPPSKPHSPRFGHRTKPQLYNASRGLWEDSRERDIMASLDFRHNETTVAEMLYFWTTAHTLSRWQSFCGEEKRGFFCSFLDWI